MSQKLGTNDVTLVNTRNLTLNGTKKMGANCYRTDDIIKCRTDFPSQFRRIFKVSKSLKA
jgi:hypothetical protein